MSTKERIITPATAGSTFGDIWRYRELFYFLVWRDVKVRYKQTVAGIAWAIIQPVVTVIVFTFLFGTVARISTGDTPYPIFLYSGLLYWTLFTRSTQGAIDSIVSNRNLVEKIYFPRLLLPLSAASVATIDFLIAFLVLGALILYYQFVPGLLALIAIPLAVALTFMVSIGLGSFLAVFNVYFRDVRLLIPFILQMLMFVGPIAYPIEAIPSAVQPLMMLNPMTGIILFVRAALIENTLIAPHILLAQMVISTTVFIGGSMFFYRRESSFVDIL